MVRMDQGRRRHRGDARSTPEGRGTVPDGRAGLPLYVHCLPAFSSFAAAAGPATVEDVAKATRDHALPGHTHTQSTVLHGHLLCFSSHPNTFRSCARRARLLPPTHGAHGCLWGYAGHWVGPTLWRQLAEYTAQIQKEAAGEAVLGKICRSRAPRPCVSVCSATQQTAGVHYAVRSYDTDVAVVRCRHVCLVLVYRWMRVRVFAGNFAASRCWSSSRASTRWQCWGFPTILPAVPAAAAAPPRPLDVYTCTCLPYCWHSRRSSCQSHTGCLRGSTQKSRAAFQRGRCPHPLGHTVVRRTPVPAPLWRDASSRYYIPRETAPLLFMHMFCFSGLLSGRETVEKLC